MKKARRLLTCILLISVTGGCMAGDETGNRKAISPERRGSFNWLSGDWIRVNEKPHHHTFESWQRVRNDIYRGVGFTLQNGDTLSRETMLLRRVNGGWQLSVSARGDSAPTLFRVIRIDSLGFTARNDSIDFPNTIQYWRDGKKIKALVAGGDIQLLFEFRPAPQ